ncbi:hypothetical protein AAFF_G00039570 [Aldrovandia affinis]|uniref:Uncharacterized protein n=1 Tax=Aldrovandia affinis TaxID=143900 RepID=A0AAD7WFA6_9TELE|nr:hypothetical protein AAFF_G00039570 [Aldrovandia affinis]
MWSMCQQIRKFCRVSWWDQIPLQNQGGGETGTGDLLLQSVNPSAPAHWVRSWESTPGPSERILFSGVGC